MTPTEIDKAAGKRYGYVPDYSIWLGGLPLVIVEAKAPDVEIQAGLRDAHLYAAQINKRYPPNVNPIGFVLASNGDQFALSEWDSETNALIASCADAAPGTSVMEAIQKAIGKVALENRAKVLAPHFQHRQFYNVSGFMGGRGRLNQQLGVNEFAQPLFPTLTKYFGSNTDDTPDDVIDRAYVTSEELGTYEGVLETYLKDRGTTVGGNKFQPIVTSRRKATGISTEVQRFVSSPAHYSRVQLIVGAVGAGKSTFIRRYYRSLISPEAAERTRWAFLNFNSLPPDTTNLQDWIARSFISSFAEVNSFDIHDLKQIERICSVELNQFERGPSKPLKKADPAEFARQRAALLTSLTEDSVRFSECLARHFSGDKGLGIVVVFDNVDRRSRDEQLKIFEAAQWFKDLTRGLIIINLRDSTFEAHREEPPLDAFINAVNFYVRPPRFAQVIRKRLELVLETLPSDVARQQQYSLPSGVTIRYPASRLGEFLLSIYISLFGQRTTHAAAALEALVAKDVRRALGMFGDIIISPHIPTDQITGAAITSGQIHIHEYLIIRSLMRGRYRYYSGKSSYVRNILDVNTDHVRPSSLLNADILEYLIRNRKTKIDFAQEGYATITTLLQEMGRLGYDEQDAFDAINTLVHWGLIEPESLVIENLAEEDAIRVHASGFIHMRFFIQREEYLVGVTPDMKFASREAAERIGRIWSGQDHLPDLTIASKKKILKRMREYMEFEYKRRCRRHAFYEEAGFGGRAVISALKRTAERFEEITSKPTQNRNSRTTARRR